MAIRVTSALIGLALVQLGVLRFLVLGSLLDLCFGLGFGSLALGTVLLEVVRPLFVPWLLPGDEGIYVAVGCQLLAYSLFAIGALGAFATVDRPSRAGLAWRVGLAAAGALLIWTVGVAARGSRLPVLVGARGAALPGGQRFIPTPLPGQGVTLVAIDAVLALLILAAALALTRLWATRGEPQLRWFSVGLIALFFAQQQASLAPPIEPGYLSLGTAYELLAYLVLLGGLVSRLVGEVAERTSQEERLRLSRELHDGLAQELALLNLWLKRASNPSRSREASQRDLVAANRLVETALLDAREAITALRTAWVSFDELARTLETLAREHSLDHPIETGFRASGRVPGPIRTDLQVELLRILQEALFNASRHAEARAVDITLSGERGSVALTVRVDGRGLDPQQMARANSAGIRSIGERARRHQGVAEVESARGQGTVIRVAFPLVHNRGARR